MIGPRSPASTTIGTGRGEIDRCLGGGICIGSLVLVEGRHATGKSVLCQHLAHTALGNGLGVAYYTHEDTSPSLISRSAALGLDLLDYFLLDRLRIFSIGRPDAGVGPSPLLGRLGGHMEGLPPEYRLLVLDSVSALLPQSPREPLREFLDGCRQVCRQGRTVVVVDPGAGVDWAVARLYPQPELRLRLELATAATGRVERTLEALRLDQHPEWPAPRVAFQVEAGWGIRIVPRQHFLFPGGADSVPSGPAAGPWDDPL